MYAAPAPHSHHHYRHHLGSAPAPSPVIPSPIPPAALAPSAVAAASSSLGVGIGVGLGVVGVGATGAAAGKRSMPPHASESPAKKQSKWSAEEDAIIIDLRGSGMKWDDISKRLPGRSAISCRLHYQNYLERRSEWDEERKNKLARLYERFKPEMWAKVAEEMQIPWRAAEAMHWQLGEQDMARRAGVTPFSLSAVTLDQAQGGSARSSPRSHGHSHSHSHGSIPRDLGPRGYSGRGATLSLPPQANSGPGPGRPLATRKLDGGLAIKLEHGGDGSGLGYAHHGGPLAPIQAQAQPRQPGMLPGVAELTTGVSPYSTPAYSVGVPSASPAHSATASPGPFHPHPAMSYPPLEPAGSKRRRSPELGVHDASRRRMDIRPEALENKASVPRHMP